MLYADGTYNGTISGEGVYGRYEVIAVTGDIYTILFTVDMDSVNGSYDNSTKVLTYDGVELDAPAVYAGRYTYRGEFLEINPNGSITGILYGVVVEAVVGQTHITITATVNEAPVTLSYDIAADTITYEGIVYARPNPIYEGKPFTTWGLVSEESDSFEISSEGIVRVNYEVVGYISDLDENARTFTINYYDGITPEVSASYTDNSVTVGETTYTKPVEPGNPFDDLPFIEQEYINEEDSRLYIRHNGTVMLNGEEYAELISYDDQSGILTLIVKGNPESIEARYNAEENFIAIGGTIYGGLVKG